MITTEHGQEEAGSGGLLAVDVGLRTGFALYGSDGRLRWYRSHNLGTAARLRRAASRVLVEAGPVSHLVLEGGGPLAMIWMKEAESRGIQVLLTSAEMWRSCLLYSREQKDRLTAKQAAGALARRVIHWSSLPGAVRLRHDAAEAILAGLWGVRELGFLNVWPRELRR